MINVDNDVMLLCDDVVEEEEEEERGVRKYRERERRC